MKLRIARKISKHKNRRVTPWWKVYTDGQFQRAKIRMRKSWSKACPNYKAVWFGEERTTRNVNDDYHRAYRVESFQVRQRALRKEWPEKYK